MEGAKKKEFDDSLNQKIQRKFDLVFGSASELISAGTKAETAAMDDDFSSLEFGSDEGSSMSESAKKEKSSPKIDLDFGNDGDLDFASMSDSPPAESKKEGTGKLSIVPDDSEGLEFNLDFGDDTPDIPAVPAATASAPSAGKAKGEATKSDSHFELDLSGGDDDHVIETRPSNTQAPAAHNEPAEGGLELGGDLFDAEIEMASSKARDEKKESTQPTIVYNKSATGIDLEAFKESTASTNSSADLMTTEEAKANIESTIKDILRPKLSADSTQEIDLSEMEEKTAEQIPEMNFSNDGFSTDEFTTDSFGADKNEATNEFDLSGMEFADKEESMAAPAVKMKAEAPVAMKAAANFDSIPDDRMERVDRAHTSFVSDEESSRFQATIRQLREERDQLLTEIKMLKGQAREIEQDNLTLKAALDEAKIENSIIRKRHMTEMEDLKYKAALAEEKRALAEEKARNAEAKKEKLEQRVRIDFNQVKQREKELETKLEMLSMDVDSQVHSRDQKILELRRKIDALEFNMENVSIREQKSKDDKRKLEDKLNKIMKTLRHSIKNLEDDIDQVTEESESDTDDKIKTGHGQR